jgi:predicted nucleotidyltransferase
VLGRVAATLRDRGIPFCVIGAAAMAVHGVARSTQDIDLLVVAPEALDLTTWEPLREDGISVTPHRGDATDPLHGVVRVRATSSPPVDVVVGRARWQTAILQRARMASIEGVEIPVARTADLMLLKLYAGGPQDAWDVAQLLEGPERPDLVIEVEQGLADLPDDSRALWRRVTGGG